MNLQSLSLGDRHDYPCLWSRKLLGSLELGLDTVQNQRNELCIWFTTRLYFFDKVTQRRLAQGGSIAVLVTSCLFCLHCFLKEQPFLLVWSNPNQSNRRSTIQWNFALWWVFSGNTFSVKVQAPNRSKILLLLLMIYAVTYLYPDKKLLVMRCSEKWCNVKDIIAISR